MAIVCVLLSLLSYVSPVQEEEQNSGADNRNATKLEMLLEGLYFNLRNTEDNGHGKSRRADRFLAGIGTAAACRSRRGRG
jgi:hypothetical protein